jgi:endoglucanase
MKTQSHLIKYLKMLLVCITITGTSISAKAQKFTAVSKHGQLKVAGGKIVNSQNEPPQLRGISLSWSIWGGRKYYNPKVVNWLTKDFKINLLRVSMAVEPDSGYLQDPVGQEKLVTNVVDAAIKQGLFVLIDWHDHHANNNLEHSKSFFSKMAKRYTGIPNVIYEVFNEPEKIEWPVVKAYAEAVITEIRKYDQKNIIVVGSPSWDQDVDIAAKDPIVGQQNIAYSFHFYASQPSHQDGLMAKADEALRLKLPLFVTEWGVGEADGDGVFDLQKNTKWMNWMEKNKLSWANWNITDKKETTAILMPGANMNGNWTEKELTPAGQYIKKQLNDKSN